MTDTIDNQSSPASGMSANRPRGKVILVGNPNVGKSALFNALTGNYAMVSNYPGTTVEIFRARLHRTGGGRIEVIDTPGMYSLNPISAEESIARKVLFTGDCRLAVHVIDAKNISRMLGLTLQLAESGLPVILAVNMMDEARRIGMRIDCARLSQLLGLPVLPIVSITGEGIARLLEYIDRPPPPSPVRIRHTDAMERAVSALAARLSESPPVTRRLRALLLLQGDETERTSLLQHFNERRAAAILKHVSHWRALLKHSPHYLATLAIQQQADQLTALTVTFPARQGYTRQAWIDRLCRHPVSGTLLLAAVLYLGFFKLVGQFGAGTLVDFIEEQVFENRLNPWTVALVNRHLPWQALRDLIAGDYGLVTLGLRYAIAIILPIVGIFFALFAILEDSGYLPRLAMLTDRLFKKLGLNGRAIIPMVLGLGCDTMATIVTRTLETTRERIIATMLLALAVPCSAQLGVILGLLSHHPGGLLVWTLFTGGVFILAGWLAARLLPGAQPSFYMEMPLLRMPRPANVLAKTASRMIWYFKEVLPIFMLASVLLWLGELTGIFQAVLALITPAVRWLGLPPEASTAFLFGFFRRDYGAAGLYDLHARNLLNGNQLTVAAITLTLFLPCVAQFLVMCRERGTRLTMAVSAGILATAFAGGWLVNQALILLRIAL